MFRRKKPESNAPPGIGGGSRVKQTRAEKQAEAAQKAAQPKKRGEVNELMAVCVRFFWIRCSCSTIPMYRRTSSNCEK